ncbi:MAG: hypothetical protein AAGD01_19725 [Acidobacteriota bacterium]
MVLKPRPLGQAGYRLEDVDIQSTWSVARVRPGGQDDAPNEAVCFDESSTTSGRWIADLGVEARGRESAIRCASSRSAPLVIADPFGGRSRTDTGLLLEAREVRSQNQGLELHLRLFRPDLSGNSSREGSNQQTNAAARLAGNGDSTSQTGDGVTTRGGDGAAAQPIVEAAAQPVDDSVASPAEDSATPFEDAAAASAVVAGAAPASPRNTDPCELQPVQRVLVLDSDPFLAAVVAFDPIGSLLSAPLGTEVANWSTGGIDPGVWHINQPSLAGFCLTLPPQAVGETMLRYRNLEEGEVADFRLGPPASLSLRTKYFQQAFPEVPWNFRRLLSAPGRELPGVELEALHLEILYGLSCTADLSSDLIRLAEVTALVGDLPGAMDRRRRWSVNRDWFEEVERKAKRETGSDAGVDLSWDRARYRWNRYHRQLLARLAVLEAWDAGRVQALQRREGVSCWIRLPDRRAAGVPSLVAAAGGADLQPPLEVPPPSEADPTGAAAQELCGPDSDKLCGGVSWGFESANIYEAVMGGQNDPWPASVEAELADLRLSALGAWGHQMSSFDQGKTALYADVSMGRTFAYRVERIGRIGVFWHRAKHIIVYERSVVPSRQFVNDQNPLGGRPVLRKVREYVELLENTRSYPDKLGGAPEWAGFVTRCTFAEDPNQVVRFAVKSAWGSDVEEGRPEGMREQGWKVPLWVVDAQPSDVFPKPRVRLTVLSVVDGKTVPVERLIENPQNLAFFTRTTKTQDPTVDATDTDLWPPMIDIDYGSGARPTPVGGFSGGRLRQTTRGDDAVPEGHSPTTFRLDPSPHGADLGVHRKNQPMAGRLSTVTMSRAPLGSGLSAPAPDPLGDLRRAIDERFAEALASLPASGTISSGHKALEQVREALEAVGGEVNAVKATLDNVGAEARAAIDTWNDSEKVFEAFEEQSQKALKRELQRLIYSGSGDSALEKALLEILRTAHRERSSGSEAVRKVLRRHLQATVQDLGRQAVLLTPSPSVLGDALLPPLRQAIADVRQIRAEAAALLTELGRDVEKATDKAFVAPERFERRASALLFQVEGALAKIRAFVENAPKINVDGSQLPIGGLIKRLESELRTQTDAALKFLQPQVLRLREVVGELRRGLKVTREIQGTVVGGILDGAKELEVLGEDQLNAWSKDVAELEKKIEALEKWKHDAIANLEQELLTVGNEIIEEIVNTVGQVEDQLAQWTQPVKEWAEGFAEGLKTEFKNAEKQLYDEWAPEANALSGWASGIETRANKLKDDVTSKLEEAQQEVDALRRGLEAERDSILEDLEAEYRQEFATLRRIQRQGQAVEQAGLRLVRAFGEPPEVGGLAFDRPEVAFFYNELDQRIGVTPVIARAAQVADAVEALKPLGVDLPVKELGEKLIPEDLRNFDLSDILPDFGGLSLGNLFSGVKMPTAADGVDVRHGLDPATRRAWFEAKVDIELAKRATVFSTGPLTLEVEEAQFEALAKASVSAADGSVRREVEGRIFASWLLKIGGSTIVSLHGTTLHFDRDGKLRFQIDAKKIELAKVLEFINQLLAELVSGIDGLTLRVEPTGVVSILSLPIPDTEVGTFGISGLSVGTRFAVRWAAESPQAGDGEDGFHIALAFLLARPDIPFNLSVFILGGGGYLVADSRYFPATGKVQSAVDMAITASASLAIALGPIKGGVYVYFGITARYRSGQGGLTLGIVFMISGRVNVLGIVSASVTLRLEVVYGNGSLVGHGHVSLRIKICWCFTLKVSKSVSYTLAGSGGGRSGSLGGPRTLGQLAAGGPGGMAAGAAASMLAQSDSRNELSGLSGLPYEEIFDRVEIYLEMLA